VSGTAGRGPSAAARPPRAVSRRPRALLPTLATVVAVVIVLAVFVDLWTERLWYGSLNYSEVFNTVLATRVGLFLFFGAALSLTVVGNIWLAHRARPHAHPASPEQQNLDRYRDAVDPLRRWILVALGTAFWVFGGTHAAGQWQTYLLWRNGSPFGVKDQFFGRDVGFFVFGYPFYEMLVGYAFAIVISSLLAVVITHYLYGGIRLQGRGQKISRVAQVHLSVLLGAFMLLKALAYWLDRFGLEISNGPRFTGISYTDAHAVLPAKNILAIIALICAVLFLANVVRPTWMLPTIGLGLLLLSAILLGAIWPAIVQHVQVAPSEQIKESPYIHKNIVATRAAYDINGVKVVPYAATTDVGVQQLRSAADNLPGTRLLDPSLVAPAFEQLQQVRGFYSVPKVLDVDRYTVHGQSRDMVVGLREVDLSGLPSAQRNWNNDHTIYTHGFGMIAAYGNERTATGEPVWAEKGLPPVGVLGTDKTYQPRVYFGELSPDYSIVGAPAGARPVELDIPDAGPNGVSETNTYHGHGGVPIGSMFRRLLYAAKFWQPNIVLSERVNSASQILYDRSPRQRVQAVAPWLTVDGDPYPAIVGGRVLWIVDCYTTSGSYPMSQTVSLNQVTSDSLTQREPYGGQSSEQINYMRNSVKAVVDAYSGSVRLYAWQPRDPILKAWRSAFPGVVRSRSTIPPDLLAHLRYPEDMFKVQREILSQYHVTNPGTFYQGSDRWLVPEDPTVVNGTVAQPPYYLSVKLPGQRSPEFSLTSVYVPQKKQNLAAFMSVDANAATKSYGRITILRLPVDTRVPGPGQMANAFNSDPGIATALLPFRQNGTQALFGNLLTLPVGNGLLYVQPVYTLRPGGSGNYPVLQLVLASFGVKVGYGANLDQALNSVLGEAGTNPGSNGPPTSPGGGNPPATPGNVLSLLKQANAKYAVAQRALARGDLQGYATATAQAKQLVQQALAQLQGQSSGAKTAGKPGTPSSPKPASPKPTSPSPKPTAPSPKPTASPTG
jgi:uncharacterized membrane protein (UPF0182 family)